MNFENRYPPIIIYISYHMFHINISWFVSLTISNFNCVFLETFFLIFLEIGLYNYRTTIIYYPYSVCMCDRPFPQPPDMIETQNRCQQNQYDLRSVPQKIIFPKSDQWPNYRRKRMCHQCFSMGKVQHNLFLCLKSNRIASQKFLMRESRYFNRLSREQNG